MFRSISIPIALFLACNPVQSARYSLPDEVAGILKKHDIPLEAVGLVVRRVDQPDALIRVNSEKALNPASVMKLVTTLAALEILGPAYTWKTRYFLDGKLSDGELTGNLVLKGDGDPYLVTEQLLYQLSALRGRGLQKISGDLIIDDSTFLVRHDERAGFDGRPDRVYNVIPSASTINFSATRVQMVPDDEHLRILIDPPAANLKLVNRIRMTGSPCRGLWNGWGYHLEKTGEQTLLDFHGKYPQKCGESEFTRAFLPNRDYTYGVFKALWEDFGGTLNGAARLDRTPPGAHLFLEAESRPLSDVITGINKFSNNIMARQLLLTIGRQVYGEPGTPETGIKGIKRWLDSEGIAMPDLVMENGAGLSRVGRISADSLSNLLQKGWESNYRPEFLSSLALAAIDGTMRDRLRKDAPAGRVRIKTGLLDQSRAMAGYVTGQDGKHYSVAMLMNHPKVHYGSGNQVQDVLLRWIMRH
jgi:serine-type D-Ala-D-Ala carboxypeptidase/endopeptidase (penicillin-binding protein 4)